MSSLPPSEIRYRRLFETARDGILILDAATRKIIDVNPFMVELLGYSRTEFIGKELWEIGLLKDSETSKIAFNELQDKGYIRYENLPLQTKYGEQRDVEFISNVYEEAGFQVIQSNIRDVTVRKQGAEALRKANEAFKESDAKNLGILDKAYDPIITVNAMGAIEFANKQTKKWFGYEPEELVGKPIEILIPARFHNAHLSDRVQYINQPVARPMGRGLQLSAMRKDGSEFPVEISLTPFHTERGVIVTAFIRDITDQKRVEEQQRFLSETSRILAETVDYQDRIQKIADLVVPIEADVCVVRMVVEDQLVATAISHSESIDPDVLWSLARNENILREDALYGAAYVWKTGKSQFIEDFNDEIIAQIVSNEDDFKRLQDVGIRSVISVPMVVRGKMIGVISLVRRKPAKFSENDIAFAELISNRAALAVDNARLLDEAQKAVGLREDVLAIVSHDLKNPLGVIKGYNHLIATSISADDEKSEISEYAGVIDRSVDQMERLVGDLLDFAKIESGTLSLQTESNGIERLVMDGIKDALHEAQRKSIDVRDEIQPGLPEVYCDAERIRQVFANLLGNAIKFSPKHGQVVVRAHSNGPEVIFSISDMGPGISPEDRPHVFERYWQGRETAKHGAGLGMSIARGIIEGHHGRIWVESEARKGTIVCFSLPISPGLPGFLPERRRKPRKAKPLG